MSDAPRTPAGVLGPGLHLLALAIREEPRIFAVSMAGSAVYGLMTVGSAVVLGRVTEQVVLPAFRSGHAGTGALVAAAAAIIAVSVVKAVGIAFRRMCAGTMQFRLQATYRRRVTRQYLRLPLAWHQRHPTGELLSNANADVEASWWPVSPLPFALGVLLMLVVAAVALVRTDLLLALVGFAVFPAIGVLNWIYNKRLAPLATRAQQLRGELSTVAHESFDGALVVKTLGREGAETARFAAKADLLRDEMIKVGRVHGMFDPVMEALPQLGTLLVLVVGAARIEAGALNPGQLVQAAYLFTLLAFPVRAIGWVLGELPRAVVGFDRVRRVLDAGGALAYGRHVGAPGEGPASLTLADVAFHYADAPVLHDVSFQLAPGRTVALVGPTGVGKSTLASLLVRLLDPTAGTIVLAGTDLRDHAPGAVAGSAALVPQQTFLFDDTVRGNVTLGAPVDDDAVWAVLRVAQADGFVAALPRGLDTRVGERGTTLSGGQRQRLALARALVRRPRLLVLDDATSSVDPSVEAAILGGLRAAASPSTVLVIAYRRATIELADEVLYLADGRIHGRGTHAELLTNSPGYAELVTAYDRDAADRARLAAV